MIRSARETIALAAVAPMRPLAWEPPHATDAALKRQKKKIKKKKSRVLFVAQR